MKLLSTEAKNLLDKLYNLRGEDSVILARMNKEREEAIETGERTKNEKAVLIDKIEKLTLEEQTLKEEGDKLTKVLSSINRDDFATVLDRLQIDFDPDLISEKLNKMLPVTVEKVMAENKKASEELENIEAEMNNAITKVEELEIRKDEALGNQAKLNEYFKLALDGNINITRDAITSLLEKFDFSEDEQREAAKILMFPEDALYEYDASKKSGEKSGKTITEVLVEAKKEVPVAPVVEKTPEIIESISEPSRLEDIFESTLNASTAGMIFEEEKPSKEKLDELLRKLEVSPGLLSNKGIEMVLENYDESLIKNNINVMKNKNISYDILKTNPEVLYDQELSAKVDKLLTVGKNAKDISLMPNVLVKYNLEGLNNTINVLKISGLDPKKVPLMAY